MKKILFILGFLILFTGINKVDAQKKEQKVVCFKSSMDCAECEKTIGDYVKFEKGVKDLAIDHVSNTVKIVYSEGKNSDENLAKAIEKKGYKAEKITIDEYNNLLVGLKESTKDRDHDNHK